MITRLRRGVALRTSGGWALQWVVGYAFLGGLVGMVLRPSPIGLLLVPFGLLWLPGLLAFAEFDDAGLRWRYFRRRDVPWTEIRELEFGVAPSRGLLFTTRPGVRVHTASEGLVLAPMLDCRWSRQLEFGTALAAAARRHGVEVRVTWPKTWRRLDAAGQSSPRPPST